MRLPLYPGFGTPLAIALTALLSSVAASVAVAELVPQSAASRAGLVRAWYSQAPVDSARGAVVSAVFDEGTIFVLSTSGSLQAIDAETGAARWTARLGSGFASGAFGPAVNSKLVGVIVGDELHLVDRETGLPKSTRRLRDAKLSAPALGETRLYTALLDGRLIAYDLDPDGELPAITATGGDVFLAPVATPWGALCVTDAGKVFKIRSTGGVAYRLDAGGPLATEPRVAGDSAYAVTRTGHLMRFETELGRIRWRSSLGAQASGAEALIGDRMYVGTQSGGMRAMATETGRLDWVASDVAEIAAVSEDRVYGVTDHGSIAVLDRASGERIESLGIGSTLRAIPNTVNDRVYLVTLGGLVQCLHEEARDEPYYVNGAPPVEGEDADAAVADSGTTDGSDASSPAEEPVADDPFAGDGFDDADDGFGDDPFGGADETDDPFGDVDTDAGGEEDPFADPFADF